MHLGGGSALEGSEELDQLRIGVGEVLCYLRTGSHHLQEFVKFLRGIAQILVRVVEVLQLFGLVLSGEKLKHLMDIWH